MLLMLLVLLMLLMLLRLSMVEPYELLNPHVQGAEAHLNQCLLAQRLKSI